MYCVADDLVLTVATEKKYYHNVHVTTDTISSLCCCCCCWYHITMSVCWLTVNVMILSNSIAGGMLKSNTKYCKPITH